MLVTFYPQELEWSPKPFMDSGLPNLILLVGSHIVRSVLTWSQHSSWESEFAGLRVEVHRARELVSGFNQVLESCERSNYWLRLANQCIIAIGLTLLFLGVVFFLLIRTYRAGALSSCRVEVAETRISDVVASGGPRSGPRRPSDLVRCKDDKA